MPVGDQLDDLRTGECLVFNLTPIAKKVATIFSNDRFKTEVPPCGPIDQFAVGNQFERRTKLQSASRHQQYFSNLNDVAIGQIIDGGKLFDGRAVDLSDVAESFAKGYRV